MTAERPPLPWFEGFEARHVKVQGLEFFVRHSAGPVDRPALLLLHGFPQTHALWHRVAQQLARHFFLVMPDLRGYGDSAKPPGSADHGNYSKRVMAADMAGVMDALGIERFALAGHDRGARVAHRLALDHAQRVSRLVLIDIAPTLDMYEGRTLKAPYMDFARSYYHWFHLVQPAPLPEMMLGRDHPAQSRQYLHAKLGGWGAGGLGHLERRALAEYERCFCTPEAIHGACEDYRAAASIDLEHDRASRAAGQKIACDTLVLWGAKGVVHRLFDPLQLWQAQCSATVHGEALPAGHFIPEEVPELTARALRGFLG